MFRKLFAAAAAVVLVAGCSDGDNSDPKAEDGNQSAATTPASPTTPALTAYDPPKVFSLAVETPLTRDQKRISFEAEAGMAGSTAVSSTLTALAGTNLAELSRPWELPSGDPATVETMDATAPMTVQLNGAEVVAVAYYQRVKGTGTNKAKVQVAFKWVNPADGKVVSEVAVDVTPTIGADQLTAGLNGSFTSTAFDATTGQVAVGLAPASLIGAKSGIFTVFADPTTKKGSTVPFLEPAGVSKGIVVGPKGPSNTERSLAIADATTGAIKKTGLTGLQGLSPAGFGQNHVYLYGQRYIKATGNLLNSHFDGYIFAVNPATGAVVETKSVVKETDYLTDYRCWGDGKNSVVCSNTARGNEEIIGFDDTTGKKTWGYTNDSGSRVVPKVTAAFHGLLYVETEIGPVLMDATTGQDVPAPTVSPSNGPSPSDSASPSDTASPTAGSFGDESPTPDPAARPQSPVAVSAYGGAYIRKDESYSSKTVGFLMILKANG